MAYIYETHVHTSEVSRCGCVAAEDVVKLYMQSGYSGIIVTDHFNRDTYEKFTDPTWQEMVDYFLRGYHAAKAAAAQLDPDFTVLLGLELRLDSLWRNDFLIYGADEDFLYRSDDLMAMDFKTMTQYMHDNGLLVVQAHPFRKNMIVVDWSLLDGVEIYNGNPNHESNNPIAAAWAARHRLFPTSGSDFHGDGEEEAAPGGICTDVPIRDNAHLTELLKTGQYTLYHTEE